MLACVAFVVQDEVAAVKEVMHSSMSAEEKCPLLYKRYTQLVQDHKSQERKIAEALRKQLEVSKHMHHLVYSVVFIQHHWISEMISLKYNVFATENVLKF